MEGNIDYSEVLSHEDLLEERLNKRYNSDFVVDRILANNMLDGFYTAIAHPAEDPGLHFRASAEMLEEGVSDNYVCKLVQRKLADRIARNLNELDGIYYIICRPNTDTYDLDDLDMSVEDYMERCPSDRFKIYLNYCDEAIDGDKFVKGIAKALEGLQCINAIIRLYLMDKKSMEKIVEYTLINDDLYHDYKIISEPFYKGDIEYRSGEMITDSKTVKDMLM